MVQGPNYLHDGLYLAKCEATKASAIAREVEITTLVSRFLIIIRCSSAHRTYICAFAPQVALLEEERRGKKVDVKTPQWLGSEPIDSVSRVKHFIQ